MTGANAKIKRIYVGDKQVRPAILYEYSYDFRGKTTTQVQNDGWTFTEGGSNYTCDTNGLRLTSSSANIRIWKEIGQSLSNAKKITIIKNNILYSDASTRLSITPQQSITNHSGINTDSYQHKQMFYIAGTDYTYTGLSAGTYTQTGVFDLVNKTATLSCTGKTDHTETLTDSQISIIKTCIYLNGYIWQYSSSNTYIQSIGITVEY